MGILGRMDGVEKPRRRFQLGLVEVLILMNVVGCLLVILVPRLSERRRLANTRSCYANQRTIAGAVEMYNLDNMTIMEPPLEPNLHILVTSGYLTELPQDPGMGEGTTGNYEMPNVYGSPGILCRIHGPIEEPKGDVP